MSTASTRPQDVSHDWYVIDATDMVLGRLATRIASVLRGKHKPAFTPHVDTGDYVVVINAEKIQLTGAKWTNKHYYRYAGHFGGLKAIRADRMRDTHPERIIEAAVLGMVPGNRLGREVLKKLKVYAGAEHPHQAQNPQPFPEYL